MSKYEVVPTSELEIVFYEPHTPLTALPKMVVAGSAGKDSQRWYLDIIREGGPQKLVSNTTQWFDQKRVGKNGVWVLQKRQETSNQYGEVAP